ncbi:hypothetical protein DYB32_003834 [Aphanomyces invadans]|uniref:Uncharacterized protein n=1 Tax=Aphanomyces invadans TaxID=157072 RepID=A0A418AZB1_9STRA|nr:hypothetical protein DYB32_003834 [Aphanomyces invadans]
MLSLWIQKENVAREVNSPHTSRINLLKWAPSGNRLITGDENGVLAVWKIDARGQVGLCTHDSQFATTACPSFFFGGDLGTVHYADDLGHISDVQTLNHAIDCMMFYEEKHRYASAASAVSVTTTWICLSGLLATASGEQLLRFWDLQKEENYVLSLANGGAAPSDRVSAVDFNPRKRILAVGTNEGKVVFWRATSSAQTKSSQWSLVAVADMHQSVSKIGWNPLHSYLYAHAHGAGVTVFHEAIMNRSLHDDTAVIQTRPMSLSVEKLQDGTVVQTTIEASIRIKGVAHDGNLILVWNGSKAEVYELQNDVDAKRLSNFKCTSNAMQLRGDVIYRTNGNHIEVTNTSGVVKNTISFTEAEGQPSLMHVNNKYLTVGTDAGLLRVFDLSRREPKAFGSLGDISKAFAGMDTKSTLRSLSVNCDGTRVSFLLDTVEGALRVRTPHTKLYLFNTDLNAFQSFEFGPARHPTSHFWDPHEARLMACETFQDKLDEAKVVVSAGEADDKNAPPQVDATRHAEREITILFASNERGLLMQDNFDLDVKYSALLGIHVPRMYLASSQESIKREAKDSADNAPVALLRTKIMQDFVGLDKVDGPTRQALIDFSYYITIGNMDEAYRSVKLIQNASVWENMANTCVKTKRLDVAEVCLGNMGHARGAAAVHVAKLENREIEAPIAMVAIQLGLLDDAARLYKECSRFDLLNKLYQAAGYWTKAIEVATKRDRIHLKTTHFAYAKHLEDEGNLKEAIRQYELAGTAAKDVPRMLFSRGKLDMLSNYATKSEDPRLLLWWAQYQESNQEFDAAIESYRRAKDYLSLVRVLCHKKDFDQAAQVVVAKNNKAAAYHLARQYEANDNIAGAIQFYAASGSYNHAIRLSREFNLDGDLMNYALLSKPGPMLECAQYFEGKREFEKAVVLYHKGGHVAKALELCFHANLFDELQTIADELGAGTNTSPIVLGKCADFFAKNGQHAKAVPLLIRANRLADALDMCVQNKVKITEDMADQLTPPKPADDADKAAVKRRVDVLMKLAKCCKHQGSFHLATKKYTQAGAKLKAMKCLLKSGDTEKVMFFANVSRNNEIFVLAANYLQNLDWRHDPEISKNVVGFYTKAKAFDQLARFYDSCAQVEIDDYKDYAKAKQLLEDAMKVATKSTGPGKDKTVAGFEHRIAAIDTFLHAKSMATSDPAEMVQILHHLLEDADIDSAIRSGDAFALLVTHACDRNDYQHAGELVHAMRQRNISVKAFIHQKMLHDIQAKADTMTPERTSDARPKTTADAKDDGDDDDELQEDIEEEDDGIRSRK